jgi:2-oxoglutarate dehydrogenase E2 component (dihydrolipoamide succinyltransferase)
MQIDVKVPTVGESITEGLLAEWLLKDGDVVRTDEPLYVLETDKVTMTVNAEHTGRLKIAVAAGEPVKIGQSVGTLDTSVQAPAAAAPPPELESRGAGELVKTEVPQTSGPPMHPIAGMPTLKANLAAAQSDDDFPPSVRRMLEEYRLDPAAIQGTGRGGRLTKEDVVAFLARSASQGTTVPQGTEPESRGAGEPEAKIEPGSRRAGELERSREKIKERAPGERQTRAMMTPIRSRIAERMLISQQSTATLTTFNEADLGALVDLRKRYRDTFKAKHGVDLTYLPFFMKAVSEALDAVPDLASWVEGAEVVRNHYRDIGIAVASEQGLAVPVLRDLDSKGIPEIQREIDEVARKVRERRITLEDLKGAVFSITNAGSYGALMGTPILNPPQSGILGMYTIQERPVARDSQVVVRPMMYLALSYDHRVVDGKAAGTFLKLVAETVANPARMLLEI